LAKNSDQEAIQTCQEHLKAFAENGYRTLCFSMRTIPEDVYQKWNAIHHEAAIALSDREKLLGNAAEEIEKELTLIGATAIEDKLQDVSFIYLTVYPCLACARNDQVFAGCRYSSLGLDW
jgi:phospholipid-transporting ATPase